MIFAWLGRKFQRGGGTDGRLLAVLVFLDTLVDRQNPDVLQDRLGEGNRPHPNLRTMITSTRSFGRMNPPALVTTDMPVETARLPEGRMDDMMLVPASTTFSVRSGSPSNTGSLTVGRQKSC